MFTGIVIARGRVTGDPTTVAGGGVRLVVAHPAAVGERLGVGASLAVAGVCLTVVESAAEASHLELSPETLERTTLGSLRDGSSVNLEPALRVGDPMGGHWVQGHVDGTVALLEGRDLGDHRLAWFELPGDQRRYVVEKGSVTLDGVSLTVAGLAPGRFSVALVPHTLEVTTLGTLAPGDRLNLEVDILAKYVERAVAARTGAP